ncbi:proline--tRNA ligase [Synechocystis sp. LKSZ1]|uniref:proline--tRNA ligase n=1 Tax=Synechocystis sp. LKSZ1 TaxID=3144951 RepID=UPI00336BB210
MRLTQMLLVTLRDDPADAEIPSHKLLLRAGYIRRIGSGIYAYLPLMWRVLQKVSQIVREEMNATGAQECLLPQLQPSELWRESGRWDTYTQAEGIMFALTDRQERELGLGPTHEEVITAIAKDMIRSYRQLPVNLYQIQTKFRDEIRPRFGLMRGREFIMKDAYSFHADEASLKQTYAAMDQAYRRILSRCGLAFRAVDADSGAIGGSGSQEFMVLADAGEDEVLYTEDGQYAANVEKAVSRPAEAVASPFPKLEKRATPNCNTIDSLARFLDCSPTCIVKNVLYTAVFDNGKTVLVLVSIRGDQAVNEVKLTNELTKLAANYQAKTILALTIPDEANLDKLTARLLPLGYLGPDLSDDYIDKIRLAWTENDLRNELINRTSKDFIKDLIENLSPASKGLWTWQEIKNYAEKYKNRYYDIFVELIRLEGSKPQSEFLRLVDQTAVDLKHFVTGANEPGQHLLGANWGQDFPQPTRIVDVRTAQVGDQAIHDPQQTLKTARGIEAGHIFQLGTKYSQALGATYTNEAGEEVPLVMGCYGIGVSRLAQSAVEQSYDKDGIIWPVAIAPYEVIVCIPNISDTEQVQAAETLYQELQTAGIEVLLDDRNERAGVKFKDADLLGIPYRIVTGKSLKEGRVEVVTRANKEAQLLPLAEVVATLKNWITAAKQA